MTKHKCSELALCYSTSHIWHILNVITRSSSSVLICIQSELLGSNCCHIFRCRVHSGSGNFYGTAHTKRCYVRIQLRFDVVCYRACCCRWGWIPSFESKPYFALFLRAVFARFSWKNVFQRGKVLLSPIKSSLLKYTLWFIRQSTRLVSIGVSMQK